MENNIYVREGKYWSWIPRDAVKSLPSEMFNTQVVNSALLPTLILPCFILGVGSEDPQISFPTQIILWVYNAVKIIYSEIAVKISV